MTPAILARLMDSEPPFVVVCAWHTSRPELEALHRQYPGQVSHSLCPACAERLAAEAGA